MGKGPRRNLPSRSPLALHRASTLKFGIRAAARSGFWLSVPVGFLAAVAAATGSPQASTPILAGALPAVAVIAVAEGVRQGRRVALVYEALEQVSTVAGSPWAQAARSVLLNSTPATFTDLMLSSSEAMRRAAVRAKGRAEDGTARTRFTEDGIAEVLADRIHAEERLRSTLAAEMHDTVAQTLGAAQWVLRQGAGRDEVLELLRVCEDQVRALIAQTRPPELGEDLAAAVEALLADISERHGLVVTVQAWPSSQGGVTSVEALTIYRFFQEALANVVKHSGADAASISLAAGVRIVATVSDRGRGFDAATPKAGGGWHVGLKLLDDRARSLGGHTSVLSSADDGTLVTLTLPGAHAAAASV